MPSMSPDDALLTRLAERAETLLARIESLLPQTPEPDWDSAVAWGQAPNGCRGFTSTTLPA